MALSTTDRVCTKRAWTSRPLIFAALCPLFLAGCEEMESFLPSFQPAEPGVSGADAPTRSTRLVERDVEAPEVFQVTEAGLWDGRPSLGGVWVAHPDVSDPERVIIRNPSNGKFVIGALFRKERDTPGPRLQVSSDAAAALALVAGQPSNLNVTALRRATTPEATPEPAPSADAPTAASLPSAQDITEQPLDDVSTTAAAALDATAPPAPTTRADAPAPAPTPARAVSSLDKPFIQIGIFSIEQNAKNTAATMRNAGLVPTIIRGSSSGKGFWRVIVGPATTADERATLLATIKKQGFTDAYAVTN
ncbi:SPOR domain-containing protein [Roseobacteraceae bacterium S113]